MFAADHLEYQSVCLTNGSWSSVRLSCQKTKELFDTPEDINRFILAIIISGICVVILIVSMTIIAALAVKRRLENLLSDSKDQLRDALRFTFSEKVRLLIRDCRKVITENHQVWSLICMKENPMKR